MSSTGFLNNDTLLVFLFINFLSVQSGSAKLATPINDAFLSLLHKTIFSSAKSEHIKQFF